MNSNHFALHQWNCFFSLKSYNFMIIGEVTGCALQQPPQGLEATKEGKPFAPHNTDQNSIWTKAEEKG